MLSTACSFFRKMKYFIHIPETGLGTISSVVTFFKSSKNSKWVVYKFLVFSYDKECVHH